MYIFKILILKYIYIFLSILVKNIFNKQIKIIVKYIINKT